MTDGSVRTQGGPPLTGKDLPDILRALPTLAAHLIQFRDQHAIRVACDVDNPLYGTRGAATIFGPQKGATPEQVQRLDAALQRFAAITNSVHVAQAPGAGAAGGLGFGLMTFLHAHLELGFQIVANAIHLADRIRGAHLIITGEGRLDASSLGGKTAIGVARLSRQLGIRCVALVGAAAQGAELAVAEGLTAYHVISDPAMPLEESMRHAPQLLETAAAELLRGFLHA
jgi:glycerate kinase